MASTLAVLVATAFVAPRALSSVSLCHCAANHSHTEQADEPVAEATHHSCCSKSSTSTPSLTPVEDQHDTPAHGSGPCDCPAYCCAGKLVSFAPSLPPDQLLRPIEQPLNVRPLTVLSLNYHADILRPPRT